MTTAAAHLQPPAALPTAFRFSFPAMHVTVEPVAGESWNSYLARTSWASRVDLAALHTHLRPHPDKTATFGDVLNPDTEYMAAASRAFGLTSAETRGMQLARYDGRYFTLNELPPTNPINYRQLRQTLWLNRTSKACPHCLARDGAWRTAWHFGWHTVCVEHQTFLTHHCPRCLRPLPNWILHTSHRLLPRTLRHPSRCQHPPPDSSNSTCNTDLAGRKAELQSAQPDASVRTREALDLQLNLEAVADAGLGTIAGAPASSPVVFAAYRAGTVLARSLRQAPGRQSDTSATNMHLALRKADQLISSSDLDTAAAVLEEWLDNARVKPTRRQLDARSCRDPGLRSVVEHVIARNDKFTTRAVQQPLWQWNYTHTHIPQVAWPCALPSDLARRRTRPSNRLLRAVVSIMVNRPRVPDWTTAAVELGWTRRDAHNWITRITTLLSRDQVRSLNETAISITENLHRDSSNLDTYEHPDPPPGPTIRRLQAATTGRCQREASDARWCPCMGSHDGTGA